MSDNGDPAAPYYRHILQQWLRRGGSDDKRLSEILAALAQTLAAVVEPVISAGVLPFSSVKSLAFDKTPETVGITTGQLLILHYQREHRPLDSTTPDYEGILQRSVVQVQAAWLVGHRAWGMDRLQRIGVDIADLASDAYQANSHLWNDDGTWMLEEELPQPRLVFGALEMEGQPVGWVGTFDLVVERVQRTQVYVG